MARLRNVPGAREAIEKSRFCITEPKEYKGRWRDVFGNDNPIHVEIGMGKGLFLMRLSKAHPEINYIGIEMYSSVLVRAIERAEQLPDEQTGNFRFIRMDAREIGDVFEPGEIEKIYLNFSDPWPKERHAGRRLTSRRFLAVYEKLLMPESVVEFKTDNTVLFDFSVEEAGQAGWILAAVTYDLYGDDILSDGNIATEYEEKFVSAGKKICKMIIHR